MTQRVKKFIEANIETIELARWEELFEGWYDTTLEQLMSWEDTDEISELFKVLEILNVTKETTSDGRKAVIEKHVEEIVDDIQHNRKDAWSWYLSWNKVIRELNSHLGFTRSELYSILGEIDMPEVTTVKEDALFII